MVRLDARGPHGGGPRHRQAESVSRDPLRTRGVRGAISIDTVHGIVVADVLWSLEDGPGVFLVFEGWAPISDCLRVLVVPLRPELHPIRPHVRVIQCNDRLPGERRRVLIRRHVGGAVAVSTTSTLLVATVVFVRLSNTAASMRPLPVGAKSHATCPLQDVTPTVPPAV